MNIITVLSKVFESILSDQLVMYFEKILSSRISAYRKGYSCQHVLIDPTEFWKSALDKNDSFCGDAVVVEGAKMHRIVARPVFPLLQNQVDSAS